MHGHNTQCTAAPGIALVYCKTALVCAGFSFLAAALEKSLALCWKFQISVCFGGLCPRAGAARQVTTRSWAFSWQIAAEIVMYLSIHLLFAISFENHFRRVWWASTKIAFRNTGDLRVTLFSGAPYHCGLYPQSEGHKGSIMRSNPKSTPGTHWPAGGTLPWHQTASAGNQRH